jgi:hypothetical protein
VFPVRYEQDSYVLFRRNSVFKRLMYEIIVNEQSIRVVAWSWTVLDILNTRIPNRNLAENIRVRPGFSVMHCPV